MDALLTGLVAVVGVLVGAGAVLAFRASEHAQQGGFPANKVSQVRAVIDPTTAE